MPGTQFSEKLSHLLKIHLAVEIFRCSRTRVLLSKKRSKSDEVACEQARLQNYFGDSNRSISLILFPEQKGVIEAFLIDRSRFAPLVANVLRERREKVIYIYNTSIEYFYKLMYYIKDTKRG